MNSQRIKEIQEETAYPNSVSVEQALLKVWNECEQEKVVKNNAVLPHVSGSSLFVIELSDEELKIVTKDELDKMYDGAMEFDGFLGYMVKGRLM
jgi:hypothetical protein